MDVSAMEALSLVGLLTFAASSSLSLFQLLKPYWPTFLRRTLTNVDSNYDEFMDWASDHIKSKARYKRSHSFNKTLPRRGWYIKFDKKTPIIVQIYFNEKAKEVRICFWTYRSEKWLLKWMKKQSEKYVIKGPKDSDSYFVRVYVYDGNGTRRVFTKKERNPETLILKEDSHLEILKDVQKFQKKNNPYREYGLSRTKGYCLYGPPGTGKSTIPFFIAGQIQKRLMVIKPEAILSEEFISEISGMSDQYVFLFDDIDNILKQRPVQGKSDNSDRSDYFKLISNLMLLFDSPLSPDGLIFFLSTNYIEYLDPALIRPGRIEKCYYIGPPEKSELIRFWKIFFPNKNPEPFLEAYGDRQSSPAAILNYLNRYQDPDKAIEKIEELDMDYVSGISLIDIEKPSRKSGLKFVGKAKREVDSEAIEMLEKMFQKAEDEKRDLTPYQGKDDEKEMEEDANLLVGEDTNPQDGPDLLGSSDS